MDFGTILLLVALPLLILGLVIFLGIRDRRSKRTSYSDGDVLDRSREHLEADAAARAAHFSRTGPGQM
ncbi:hypothetical protein [Mycetocola zhadangensis]|uniref:Uncharacterized protein n=1 Tax=Mycetocola zhadangensis TaxID=1164595 RepID=A0A3L7J0J2_9MICO|nr:hypothetical protein [Mycetocola zhadangensis]RLQ83963.1 hypothetical protein D9V28_06845 [Mycetocola zhadangensis]GGE97340.1 hypothetical protein GCM10011313_20460 [Mycetocola zhadangensis]